MATITRPTWFASPSTLELGTSKKKVFAHYFTPFPISIGNADPEKDYYATQYLRADGENSKWRKVGGFLRERPLVALPPNGSDRKTEDLETEVRRAIAAGIDGFTVDLLSTPNMHDGNWVTTIALIKAAEKVDPKFLVVPMPDVTAGYRSSPELITEAVMALSKYPNVYRLDDGRMVVSPYCAHILPPEWWANWLGEMKAKGVPVALLPLFQGWRGHVNDYASVSIGASDWGLRSVATNKAEFSDAATFAHKYVPIYMAPVAPQDYRPKDLMAWEASNSENYRTMWRNAIDDGADWVQLITWNDYSESTEVSPSTGTQYSFYDLTAYYAAWFKSGHAPKITNDAIYYFHRIQPSTASYNTALQLQPIHGAVPAEKFVDDIELLAFLTKPGTISITAGGKTTTMDAPAGMTSLRAPIAAGVPSFALARNGKTQIALTSAFPIVDHVTYQDFLYRGGSSTRPIVDLVQSAPPGP